LLPAMPAVAVLIGVSPPRALRRDAALTAALTVAAGLVLLSAGTMAPRFIESSERNQYFLLLAGPLREIGMLLGVAGTFVLLRCRGDLTRAVVLLGVGWCLAGLLLSRAAAAVAPIYSGVVLARAFEAQHVPGDVPLYSVGTYDQTLPFYVGRKVSLVAYRGELDFGLTHDPGAESPAVTAFVAQWRGLVQGYAVMEKAMFEDLEREGVPMRRVASDVHRVLVARR